MASNPAAAPDLEAIFQGPVPQHLTDRLGQEAVPVKPGLAASRPPAPRTPTDHERQGEELRALLSGHTVESLDVEVEVPRPDAAPASTSDGQGPAGPGPTPPAPPAPTAPAQEGAPPARSGDGAREGSPEAPNPAPPAADPLASERATLEAQRKQLEDQQKALQEERTRWREETAKLQVDTGKARSTADDYDRLARDYEQDGNDELATLAREKAREVRARATQLQDRARQARYEQAKHEHDRAAVLEYPDLRNPGSEFAREVGEVLKARPHMLHEADGVRAAAQYVAALRKGREVDNLKAKLAETENRLAERERMLQPGIGAPPAAPVPADFDSLPLDKQRDVLKAQLRAAEEQGVKLL